MFKRTTIQVEAMNMIQGPQTHTLLRGGSRSGKTVIFTRAVMMRGLKVPESRHIILRKHFASVKQSVWYDTLPFVVNNCFPEIADRITYNKSDWFLTLPNGSEMWFGGLDDNARVEKILGKEYSTIFFNEVSEISYASVGIALTRLSQKNALKKKAFYDCNPPKIGHWSDKLFLQHVDPNSAFDEPISDPENYATMMLNPKDNEENLDPNYISGILDKLPLKLRLRFRDGQYGSDDSDIFLPEWIVPSITHDMNQEAVAAKRKSLEDIQVRFSFCDPAYTDKIRQTDSSCESAIITVGVDTQGVIHDLEVLHGFWTFEQLKQAAKSVYARHGKAKHYSFGIEDVAAQRWLRDDLAAEPYNVPAILIHPDGGKIQRAISVTDLMEQGRTRVNDRFLSAQLLGFPGENLKDLVDAYVYCLKMVKKYGYGLHVVRDENAPIVLKTYDERVQTWLEKKRERARRIQQGGARDPVLGKTW